MVWLLMQPGELSTLPVQLSTVKGSQHWLPPCINIYCSLEPRGSELVAWFLINSQSQYLGWFKCRAVSVLWAELAEVCWTCRFVMVSLTHRWLCPGTPRLFHWFRVCSQLGSGCLSSENGFNHLATGSSAGPLKCTFTQPHSSLGSLKNVFPKLNMDIQLAGGTQGTCAVAWKITLKISMFAL